MKIVSKQLTVSAAAAEYSFSRRHLHRLLARYRDGGLDAVEPRSRAPHTSPQRTAEKVRGRILELRGELTANGLDAGPVTIAWHLEQERLADGTDIEILNWLDDHSRYLLSCTAHRPVTGDHVVATFLTTTEQHGVPASTLTDNGRVYTARFGGGRNAFEYLLPLLGVTQKNGSPGHPQTQGKIERFHQTLKRWLTARPAARSLTELQQQLDTFRDHYNKHRPHRALDRQTPGQTYHATPKALPADARTPGHYRIRYDHVDQHGKISLRRAGRMHRLGIGANHRGTRILAMLDDTTVTVIALNTGETLSTHTIDPTRSYWRNNEKAK